MKPSTGCSFPIHRTRARVFAWRTPRYIQTPSAWCGVVREAGVWVLYGGVREAGARKKT